MREHGICNKSTGAHEAMASEMSKVRQIWRGQLMRAEAPIQIGEILCVCVCVCLRLCDEVADVIGVIGVIGGGANRIGAV